MITVIQMPAFKRVYKKLNKNVGLAVDAAIHDIIKNPKIGEEKKEDLAGIFLYKFKINQQEMLLAYTWDTKTRILMCLGVHENFTTILATKPRP